MSVYDVARALPDIETLRDRCRALAMLDAILSPETDYRYYSFNARWGEGEQLASMNDGQGDAWSVVFSPAGVFIRGFDHESVMSPAVNDDELWPGLVDTLPQIFSGYANEPAFSYEGTLDATVCLWRQSGDERWHAGDVELPEGDDPDGARWMFEVLTDATPRTYQAFAEHYHEQTFDGAAIAEVFALRPLTDDLVRRLNPGLSVADLAEDLAGIGWSEL